MKSVAWTMRRGSLGLTAVADVFQFYDFSLRPLNQLRRTSAASTTEATGEHNVPLVVALIAGCVLLYGASILRYHGYFWADQVCQAMPTLCGSPHWVALIAAAGTLVYLLREFLTRA
jgi:uncharacterized membrane protein YidH (DUF202 family)